MAGTTDLDIHMMGADGIPYTISGFLAATDGLYQKLDQNAKASANSPDNAIIRKDSYIVDIVSGGGTTAGSIELVSNGLRTQIMVDLAMQYPTSSGRPVMRVPIARGTELRILAITTLTVA